LNLDFAEGRGGCAVKNGKPEFNSAIFPLSRDAAEIIALQAGRTNRAWSDLREPVDDSTAINLPESNSNPSKQRTPEDAIALHYAISNTVKQRIRCWCQRAVFNAAGCPLRVPNLPSGEWRRSARDGRLHCAILTAGLGY
jgi:hypothetical protein